MQYVPACIWRSNLCLCSSDDEQQDDDESDEDDAKPVRKSRKPEKPSRLPKVPAKRESQDDTAAMKRKKRRPHVEVLHSILLFFSPANYRFLSLYMVDICLISDHFLMARVGCGRY